MVRRIILILILSLFLTSCAGAAPAATEAPQATEPPATEAPAATEEPVLTESLGGVIYSPTLEPSTETSTPAPTKPAPSNTPAATLTETPLPTLELPTEVLNAPVSLAWDGVPTYPGDSTPGYSFRVRYDPDLWALTTDQFGFPALGHRNIPSCVISVTSGHGLPANMTVEHDMLRTDTVTFDVGIVFENGVKKFVTYTGGDQNVITAFEVSFVEEGDACLADAVKVLTTLRSVPTSQATPTATP